MRILVFSVVTMMAVLPVCAQDEKPQEDNFFSETISSVFNKVDKITSGQEKIIDENARGIDDSILEYDGDPLGNMRVRKKRPAESVKKTPLEEKIEGDRQ